MNNNFNKKYLRFLLAFLCLSFLPTKLFAEEKIKVGVLLSFSGDLAPIGTELRDGMLEAYKEIEDPLFSFVFEDDRTLDKTSLVNSTNRLINSEKVDLVINESINTIKAISPILKRYKVPGISIWDNSRSVCNNLKDIYCFGFGSELAGEVLAEYHYKDLISKNQPNKKVAIFSAIDDWSEQVVTGFKDKASALGIEIVFNESFNPEEKDYRTQISKAINNGAEVIFAPLLPWSITTFIRQVRELGFKGTISTGDSLTLDSIKELGATAEGIISTQVWSKDKMLEIKYKDKLGNNQDKFNRTDLGFFALGYDCVKLLEQLTKKIKNERKEINKQSLTETLRIIEHNGITGKFSGKNNVEKTEPVIVVRNGGMVEVD